MEIQWGSLNLYQAHVTRRCICQEIKGGIMKTLNADVESLFSVLV